MSRYEAIPYFFMSTAGLVCLALLVTLIVFNWRMKGDTVLYVFVCV